MVAGFVLCKIFRDACICLLLPVVPPRALYRIGQMDIDQAELVLLVLRRGR